MSNLPARNLPSAADVIMTKATKHTDTKTKPGYICPRYCAGVALTQNILALNIETLAVSAQIPEIKQFLFLKN